MSSIPLAPQTLSALVLSILLLHQHQPTGHEINVAALTERHLRHLSPLPMRALQAELGSSLHLSPQPSSSILAIQHLLNDADEFFAITLLSPAEFFLLHLRLKGTLITSRNHPSSASAHLHPMPTKLNTTEQLLLWILHIADEGNKALSLLFGNLDITTVFRIADHVTWCVNTVFDELIQWPSAEERQQLHGFFSVCDTVVAVMDGTHCEINKPTYDEMVYHSGYKHKHTQNYLVCVTVLGVVVHVEGPFPGRKNDRGVYNSSHIGSHPEQFFSDGERLLADGGFVGGSPLLVHTYWTPGTDASGRSRRRCSAPHVVYTILCVCIALDLLISRIQLIVLVHIDQ
jgi:hypothetical protein